MVDLHFSSLPAPELLDLADAASVLYSGLAGAEAAVLALNEPCGRLHLVHQ